MAEKKVGVEKKAEVREGAKKVKGTKEEVEKKGNEIKYIIYSIVSIIGIFLILLFASKLSVGEEKHYVYNGFDFYKQNDVWYTQIQPPGEGKLYNLQLRYGPKEVEDIPIIGNPELFLGVNALYMSFDPYSENVQYIGLAIGDIDTALIKVGGIAIHTACTVQDNDACVNVSIKNCDNTNEPVIVVGQDRVAFVEHDGNCLKVYGKDMDVVRAADRLLLYWYGIMP